MLLFAFGRLHSRKPSLDAIFADDCYEIVICSDTIESETE